MIKYLLPLFLLFFIGCDGDKTPKNEPPIAKITINTTTLNPSETLILNANASSDSDGQIVRYEWSENNIPFARNSETTWIAPNEEGTHTLTLKVTDDDGATSTLDVEVTINGLPNNAPVANIALSSQTITLGESITLDASASSDSDGSIESYTWKTSNSETFTTKIATWTPDSVGDYTLTLTVKDDKGATNTQNISITVLKADVPREIFLIGDSTVNVGNPIHRGWGQLLGTHMKDPSLLFNRAEGGSSSRSYKIQEPNEDYWWSKLQAEILSTDTSTGAYLMIQLGHEDTTDDEQEARDTSNKYTMPGRNESFYNELSEYITWAKSHNITPVLVTPVEPMSVPTERYFQRSFGDYAETVRQLAEDTHVILLDLEEKSWQVFNTYTSKAKLLDDFGVASSNDDTHFSEKGATTVSSWIKELACAPEGDAGLCAQFK